MSSCTHRPFIEHSLFTGMQLVFIASFLSLFFFLYVVKVEREEFQNQINLIVDNIYQDLTIDKPKFHNPTDDSDIKNHNDELMSMTKKLVIMFFVGMIVIFGIFYALGVCIPIKDFIVSNVIIVFFIGLTEFLILTFVGRRYISVDPNKVKYNALTALSRYADSHKGVNEPDINITSLSDLLPDSQSFQDSLLRSTKLGSF